MKNRKEKPKVKNSLFVLAMASAFALASCGAKPVTGEEFVQKVTDGFSQSTDWQYDTAIISGYIKIGETKTDLNNNEKGTCSVIWTGKIAAVTPSLAALEDEYYVATISLMYRFFQLTPALAQTFANTETSEKETMSLYAGSTYKADYADNDGNKLVAEWNGDFLVSKFHTEVPSQTTPITVDVSCDWRVSN